MLVQVLVRDENRGSSSSQAGKEQESEARDVGAFYSTSNLEIIPRQLG